MTTAAKPIDWTASDIPNLAGFDAIVTGANSGLGLVTATQLAAHGAHVTLAVRDTERGEFAAESIRTSSPGATVEVSHLDLASLASVRQFTELWIAAHPAGLNLLINNAGVMAIPRRESADGFEKQLATNHLGHFALTGLLLPALITAGEPERSRVVTVSSQAHRFGRMNFDDLQGERKYRAWGAYGQSKLANLLFANELNRRLRQADVPVSALAVHPGYAATNLQSAAPRMKGSNRGEKIMGLANRVLAQSAEMGALPTLYAATEPGLPGGLYVGPDGFGEQRGHPTVVGMSAAASNRADASRLWVASEELTGVHYLNG
ncbi:MAG: oxidoreductase [Candidatus Nanopelagicales bacterium]|nr:oxidoreductase [Candidatus Nanopelagicales bacterium]